MATLHIKSWSKERAWASSGSWSLKAYCQRIQNCTDLQGTELKRVAKLIMNKELKTLENVNKEKAEAIRHTLESSGAEVEIK
ncbi:MAG: ribosomal protein L7/L12 [Gammaproteobacteria bacterium]|nr:ribosomal protein L7/L12 [Gammaproteobacteria bacterium]